MEYMRKKSPPLQWKSEIMGEKITWKSPDGITLSGYITYSTQSKSEGDNYFTAWYTGAKRTFYKHE